MDAVEVRAIRAALSRYPSLSSRAGQQATTLAHVTRQLTYVDQAWLSSHFTVVARHLPKLIEDAQGAAQSASAADELEAQRALVVTYRLASSMLLKFDARDIAWLAADRAMHTALAIDDTVALARATRSVARAMTSTGQRADAIVDLTGMTDRMRSELSTREHELLALYGMLFLAAATNVALHRVAALVRLHEGGRALEYANSIDPASVAALPPERRVNDLLDMTEAYAHTRKYQDAVRTLSEAERVAPEEVRCRPLAHGLMRSLLNHTRGEPSDLVRQMASRAGVTA